MAETSTQVDRDRDMLTRALEREGYGDVDWTEEDGRPCVVIGRFRVIEGDNDTAPYVDAEGELRASVVGAQEYGNERVYWSLQEDGMDGGDEVRDLSTLECL